MNFSNLLKRKKVIFITTAVIIIAAAAALALVLSSTGKPALKAYLDAEGKSLKRYFSQVKNTVAEMRENVSVYNKEPYKRRTELTAGIVSGDKSPFGLKNAQDFFDVIARCKLVSDTRRDPAGGRSLSAVSLLFDKSPFLDAGLVSENNSLTFSVPTILPDRYFGMDRSNIDKVYDRFSIPVRPKRVLSYIDIVNSLEFNDGAFDKSMAAYGEFVSSMLSEGNVRYGKNIKLDIAGKKADCREIKVTFDKGQAALLIKGLAKRLSEDDALIGMTFGNAAGVSGLVRDAGFFSLLNFLEKSGEVVFNDTEKKLIKAVNIENSRESFVKRIASLPDGYEFPDGLQMTVVVDRSGNILGRRLSLLSLKQGTQNGFRLELDTGSKSLEFNDFRNFFVDASITQIASSGDSIKLHIETNLLPGKEKGDIAGGIKADFSEKAGGTLKSALDSEINIDSALDKLTLKRQTRITYEVKLDGASTADKGRFTGEFNTASWSNKKFNTRNSNTGIALNLQMPSFDAGDFKLKLNLAREDKFGIGSFKLPDIDKAAVVHLDTASDAELNKVRDEALAAFGTFYMTNKPVFDAVLGAK